MSKILISCKRSTCPKVKAKKYKKYNPMSQIKYKVRRIMLKEKKKKTGESMSVCVCVCLNCRSIIGSASSLADS